ncbi:MULTISPECIES: DsbA family protein [Paracoccus]|uniref:DsbA family protein n=1 Tax=Paracoccus yeei TaxID=147645 RepID=A0A386UTS3_9RHOB|nr:MULTISPECIES: DsbA family protein [Paracoccus]AYF03826.1 DsbA family protein [Paracoccus yeei]QEU06539.1 DsbA family protein [Paracoccus yeei]TNC04186.1 DsbA family protein [Paracoccus marcusii]
MVQRRSVLRLALAGPALALAPRLVAASHSLPPAFRRQLERDPNAPALGNPDGNATLVEFFDYNCQFCRAMLPVVGALLDTDRSLRLVMREWPVFGEGSVFAARAALASRSQGRYPEFHRALLQQKARAEQASVLRTARSIGLDARQLQRDMDRPEVAQHIEQSNTLAAAMGLVGTPTFIAGSDSRFGAVPLSELAGLVAAVRKS